MKNKKEKGKFYITTAIDYVNAEPHLGHAYEKILADVIARWHRLLGYDVFFLTGTDENAEKNEKAAKEAGIPVRELVEGNTRKFQELCKILNISNDDFIRTTEERHVKTAQEIFKKLYEKKLIYKGIYEGLYCVGCEAFLTEKDLVDGKCPIHNKIPERIKEEEYFFRLSKFTKKVINLLEKKSFIIPESKRKEMLVRLKEQGLKDLCVSRKNLNWGINVPFDKDYKIYVWIDALINYLSALDWPGKKFKDFWPAVHVIGKDINWFHSVIWPSLLFALKIKVPKKILVHGFINIRGEKLSKTSGLTINVHKLVKKYSTDSLRYFLLRSIVFGQDGDFSEKMLIKRNNDELANKLGNLLSRVVGLIEKFNNGKIEKSVKDKKLFSKLNLKKIKNYMKNYELDKALNEIFLFIDVCNEYIQENKPWELAKKKIKEFNKIIYNSLEALRIISILLYSFIPESCEKIAKQLNFNIKSARIQECKFGLLEKTKIKKSGVLFKKLNF